MSYDETKCNIIEQDILKRDENNELRDKLAFLESKFNLYQDKFEKFLESELKSYQDKVEKFELDLKLCQDKVKKIESTYSNMFLMTNMYYINRDGCN